MTAKKENTATAPAFDPTKVKVKRVVTLPLRKWKVDEPAYLRFESEIFTGKQLKGSNEELAPADLANCIDLETGEQVQIIVGAVLKSTLNDEYPNNGYVGKSFMITQSKVEGKRYKTYRVVEIEV